MVIMRLFGFNLARKQTDAAIDVSALADYVDRTWGGEKFYGGFGPVSVYNIDYWALRAASAQLFTENLYARGLLRRLVTNEIGTGLTPEAAPDERVIGVPEDSLTEWSEDIESRFAIWASMPSVCDYNRQLTYGELQAAARLEALIEGDILKINRVNPVTGSPMVQLISGRRVMSPYGSHAAGERLKAGHVIRHGVELDPAGRQVAYWIRTDAGTFERIPAFGPRSGRRLARLVYGCDKRADDVRGEPLLAIVLQSLKEIDRYRDSVQRKAVINSILAMFVKKGEDKMGSLPITGGAVRRDKTTVTDSDGKQREYNIAKKIPGLVIETLQHGEEPVAFKSETDLNFGVFEAAIIQAVAWANEVPPEILTLAFSNNYSASQAAINEFKIYLNKIWYSWGVQFCMADYHELLINEVLRGRIAAPGMVDAMRDPKRWDVYGAWLLCDWYGSIKPSTDMLKQAKGSKMLVDEGWSTNARESRITTGTKFSKNIKRLKRENEQKAEAARPLLELRREFGEQLTAGDAAAALDDRILDIVTGALDEHIAAAKGA